MAADELSTYSPAICRRCTACEVNEMSDEMYCNAMDGKQIRMRKKRRPDWCPRLGSANYKIRYLTPNGWYPAETRSELL